MSVCALEHPMMPVTTGERRTASKADLKLAARLQRQDEAAVRAVHAEHGAAVFGFLRRALRDDGEAEDVFQQVMLEVWRRGSDYDPARGSVLTWVMTITRSRAIDTLRKRRPEPRDPALIDGATTDAEVDALAERWQLAALLQQLPDHERALLDLRFRAELSQTEIADRTGIPLGTVKSRMVRGLERLRELLDQEEGRG